MATKWLQQQTESEFLVLNRKRRHIYLAFLAKLKKLTYVIQNLLSKTAWCVNGIYWF